MKSVIFTLLLHGAVFYREVRAKKALGNFGDEIELMFDRTREAAKVEDVGSNSDACIVQIEGHGAAVVFYIPARGKMFVRMVKAEAEHGKNQNEVKLSEPDRTREFTIEEFAEFKLKHGAFTYVKLL